MSPVAFPVFITVFQGSRYSRDQWHWKLLLAVNKKLKCESGFRLFLYFSPSIAPGSMEQLVLISPGRDSMFWGTSTEVIVVWGLPALWPLVQVKHLCVSCQWPLMGRQWCVNLCTNNNTVPFSRRYHNDVLTWLVQADFCIHYGPLVLSLSP